MIFIKAKKIFNKKYGNKEKQVWILRSEILKDEKIIEYYKIETNNIINSIEESKGESLPWFGIQTIDVSKNITKILKYDNNVPFYKIVSEGLNIQSVCNNKECEANNGEVLIEICYVYNYDLL